MAGIKHTILVIGINSLTEVAPAPEVKNLTKHFPTPQAEGRKSVQQRARQGDGDVRHDIKSAQLQTLACRRQPKTQQDSVSPRMGSDRVLA